jgi:HTH-type transcriptional regulator/antitoxin HigA
MTESTAPFAPDWVSPPGDTIQDLMEERGWNQTELAERLGYSTKHVSLLVNGKAPLSEEAAMRLERVLGSTASFWLTREAKYREHSARLEAEKSYSDWVSWLEKLPLKEMMKLGRIHKRRLTPNNKPAIVGDCLHFFGVATPGQWEKHYVGMQASFRRSRSDQADIGAISAWLRMGEQEAEGFSCPKYDKAKFVEALREIRELTTLGPEQFEPVMKSCLRNAGVKLIFVPSIRRSHVSGVARWLSRFNPLIQLSLYGKTNDKFWFTFFHEAAHILLHAENKHARESVFLDDPNAGRSDDPKEVEADCWAADILIPPDHTKSLPWLRKEADIVDFAKNINIHPGIVVGRLQHEGIVPWSRFNQLKVSFELN